MHANQIAPNAGVRSFNEPSGSGTTPASHAPVSMSTIQSGIMMFKTDVADRLLMADPAQVKMFESLIDKNTHPYSALFSSMRSTSPAAAVLTTNGAQAVVDLLRAKPEFYEVLTSLGNFLMLRTNFDISGCVQFVRGYAGNIDSRASLMPDEVMERTYSEVDEAEQLAKNNLWLLTYAVIKLLLPSILRDFATK